MLSRADAEKKLAVRVWCAVECRTMKCILSQHGKQWQELTHDWYGNAVWPPLQFAFTLEDDFLCFYAKRAAAAVIHPHAQPGGFQPELWMYDVAEFFIAAEEGSPYMEVNLCPNGAWWACLFSAARVATPGAEPPAGVQAEGSLSAEGWACSIRIPVAELQKHGIAPTSCRLAATAILDSPQQIFLTTAPDLSGEPDFHRPHSWEPIQSN